LVGGTEFVGANGMGVFNQTGGTNTIAESAPSLFGLYLGQSAGSAGMYALGGTGVLSTSRGEIIGYNGTGIFNQTGGRNNAGTDFDIGENSGSLGTYVLSGAGFLTVKLVESVGVKGTGVFNQSGGRNVVPFELDIGIVPGSSGTYAISGGTLTVRDGLFVGGSGPLALYASGGAGAFALCDAGQVNVTGGLTVYNTGQLNLNGGTAIADALALLGTTATLETQISGYAPGVNYDFLTITGSASLAGTLDVDWANGFVPQVGDQFTLLTAAGGITADFADMTSDDPGFTYTVDYGTGNNLVEITVTAVPEPSGVALAVVGVGGLRRRRRKLKVVNRK
jgi:MYXO-CTERM domain-containing protein